MVMKQEVRWFRYAFAAWIALFALPGAIPAEDKTSGSLRVVNGAESSLLYSGARLIAEYRSIQSPRKPYVGRLFSPAGIQVLRDSPSDHKHHHALMFALSVNGVNFWEEDRPESGMEMPATSIRPWRKKGHSIRAEGLAQDLYWTDPASGGALLFERRTVAAMQGADIPATLLLWRSRLQPAGGRNSVELGGAHYFGLGIRFVTSMDQGGTFFNSEKAEGEVVRGTERLTPSRWTAYSAEAEGKPVTVAIFDHPSNSRHPSRMFTMTSPFAYLAATLNLWKEPWTLEAKKPLELTYGVAVWDGRSTPELVEKLYRKWLEFLAH
jgi:hypothetical protein